MGTTESPRHPLYGKRKRKVNLKPNKIILEWIEEWRKAAALKNMKTKYIYAQAKKSLQRYPLPLYSGADCQVLQYFGDKICQLIDERIAKHIAEHGVHPLGAPLEPLCAPASPHSSVQRPHATPSSPTSPSSAVPASSAPSTSSVSALLAAAAPRKARKPYMPQPGSAAYALLIALYRDKQSPDCRGFLTKADLIDKAQPLTETPLTEGAPDAVGASRFYTGWSSMKQLMKQNLVLKQGQRRFMLTPAGCDIAETLEQSMSNDHLNGDGSDDELGPSVDAAPLSWQQADDESQPPIGSEYEKDADTTLIANENEIDSQNGGQSGHLRQFWYVSSEGQLTVVKDEAHVTVDDATTLPPDGLGLLVCVPRSTTLHFPTQPYVESTFRSLTPLVERALAARHLDLHHFRLLYVGDFFAPDAATPPLPRAVPARHIALPTSQGSSRQDGSSQSRLGSGVASQRRADEQMVGGSESSLGESASSVPSASRRLQRHVSSQSLKSVDSQTALQSQQSSATNAERNADGFVLEPGTFSVVMIVDNCEYYGHKRNQSLLPELMKNGVECEVRKLHVGDFVWVAKERVRPLPGQVKLPKARELVLDHVVERKRMDDLAKSIMDGRFHEQKHRLKASGLRDPIYLVESYAGGGYLGLPESSLAQSVSNTQLQDRFFVKFTNNLFESVTYLTVLSRYLASVYHNKRLVANNAAGRAMPDLDNSELELMTFDYFNIGSIKNRELSVSELFAKQLLQISCLSVSKCLAILNVYPTLSSLYSAYERLNSNADRLALLSEIVVNDETTQCLGTKLSADVCRAVWGVSPG